jgi:hypothetical protein
MISFIRRRLSWLRPLAIFVGLASFIGGVVALFTIDNSAGSLFLITLGLVMLLAAAFATRIEIESFALMGATIRVREVVRSRVQLAQRVGADQDDGRGVEIREEALTLQKLVALYDLYEYIRRTQPFSAQRTRNLDDLALRMQGAGREVPFDPAEVSTWFHQGDDPLRVVALNVMLARAECRDFLAVIKCVDEPRSNFEQYYGLQLGREMLRDLDDLEGRLLADAIERARRKRRFRRDEPLMRLSEAMLAHLESVAPRD